MADKFLTNVDAPMEILDALNMVSLGICPECGSVYDRLNHRCTNTHCVLGSASYQ
jgi:hypothetical protein